MYGKTVIVTGAGSGMGLETADALVRKGASLVLIERDRMRGEAAAARIAKNGPKPRLFVADLSWQADVRRVAREILASTPRIDVLINNAGAMFTTRQVTIDGLEQTFALNHMGYFLLSYLLLDRIVKSVPSRIVSVSSASHRGVTLDFDDLQTKRDYSGFRAYRRSKLANILFTRALAHKLEGTGVTANSLDPGMVGTRFFENVKGGIRLWATIMQPIVGISPAKGAHTSIYLATSADVEGITNEYFVKCKVTKVSNAARDDVAAERLWVESLRLARLEPEAT
jgi:NAD(P)-dependent dehydrogenase (short-subunit alcohol dehydrogenase family)